MKKRFKKVYVEITNHCNLRCSFCSKTKRKLNEMTLYDFEKVLQRIKDYTDYIYLHVLGEPLLHSDFDNILSLCDEYLIKVNITTNGTLLKKRLDVLKKHFCVRQVNISLHCEGKNDKYFDEVFESCDELCGKVYINYRLWTLNDGVLDEESTDIVENIVKHYELSTDIVEKIKKEKQIKICTNIFVDKNNLFVWPSMDKIVDNCGFCYALSTHVAILVNGDVVPCCLDSEGDIVLGNIFEKDLKEILNSERATKMLEGFRSNQKIEELCKHCHFLQR